MSESKFTPGPWAWYQPGSSPATNPYSAAFVIGPKRVPMDKSEGFTISDAMLMAAAPELLEALVALKREIILSDVNMDYIDSHFKPWLDKASAAIQKATS
ncbi:hypothetical protein [Pseudomonas sp. CCC4.4]|uniref:hypothetical protein n=1 Tax=Pseudomonas sp. CCC4.4 TaxID=3048612 RepID=UPI002B2324B5|nr:hypothetical protein [Pseudomonas sp. CCC4.4]MEB0170053.1 hypothetical protein [Pseudomonas sp. CCC4.4]